MEEGIRLSSVRVDDLKALAEILLIGPHCLLLRKKQLVVRYLPVRGEGYFGGAGF